MLMERAIEMIAPSQMFEWLRMLLQRLLLHFTLIESCGLTLKILMLTEVLIIRETRLLVGKIKREHDTMVLCLKSEINILVRQRLQAILIMDLMVNREFCLMEKINEIVSL